MVVPAFQARQRLARRGLGVVCSPFLSWRHKHAVHHATPATSIAAAVGDVHTLTVDEYRPSPEGTRSVTGSSATRS